MTQIGTAVNYALMQSLWQGAVVALGLSVVLIVLRGARARYAASCVALAALAVWPLMTGMAAYSRPVERPGVATTLWAGMVDAPMISSGLDVERWVLPLWLLGVAISWLRLLLGYRSMARLRASGAVADERLRAAFEKVGGGRIRLAVSSVVDAPSVVGYWGPVILVPVAALAGLSTQQLEAILAHEIAHLRRGDHWVNMVQCWIEVVMCYHPAAWWISARVRHERELCCDDAAVAVCGDAGLYARALVTLEKLRVEAPRVALASNGGSLLYRIERLAGTSRRGTPLLPGLVALAGALLLLPPSVREATAQAPIAAPSREAPPTEPTPRPTPPPPVVAPRVVLAGALLLAELDKTRQETIREQSAYARDVMGVNPMAVLTMPELQTLLQKYGSLRTVEDEITRASSPEAKSAAEARARTILAEVQAENAQMQVERAAVLEGTGRIFDQKIRAIEFDGVPEAKQTWILERMPNWIGQAYTQGVASNIRLVVDDSLGGDARILLKREEGFEVTVIIRAPTPKARNEAPALTAVAYQAPQETREEARVPTSPLRPTGDEDLDAEIRQAEYWAGWEFGYVEFRLNEKAQDLESAAGKVLRLSSEIGEDPQTVTRLRQALKELQLLLEEYRQRRIAIEGRDQRPVRGPRVRAL